MRRDLMSRIRRLEKLSQIDANLVLTFPDGKQTRISGSARQFFRLAKLLPDPETPGKTRTARSFSLAEQELDSLRRAVRIEGGSAQQFGLLQALVLGPAGEENCSDINPEP